MSKKKFNAQDYDPENYEKAKDSQNEMRKKFESDEFKYQVAKLCPFCKHRLSIICSGQHGYISEKCSNCGEVVVFPPISFRRSS